MVEFQAFPKIPRLNREVIITEKIDGTNGQVYIRPLDDTFDPSMDTLVVVPGMLVLRAGSRNRWLPAGGKGDNYGFGQWVRDNAFELSRLGPGRHFGEWWGQGIQRNYGLDHRRFSLFNTSRWDPQSVTLPGCCSVVPVLASGPFDSAAVDEVCRRLRDTGSMAAPGFSKPEGVIMYHVASGMPFKVLLENDDVPKGAVALTV